MKSTYTHTQYSIRTNQKYHTGAVCDSAILAVVVRGHCDDTRESFTFYFVLGGSGCDHFVHRYTHRVSRGVLIAAGRPDGRLRSLTVTESSVLLACKQVCLLVFGDGYMLHPLAAESGIGVLCHLLLYRSPRHDCVRWVFALGATE